MVAQNLSPLYITWKHRTPQGRGSMAEKKGPPALPQLQYDCCIVSLIMSVTFFLKKITLTKPHAHYSPTQAEAQWQRHRFRFSLSSVCLEGREATGRRD